MIKQLSENEIRELARKANEYFSSEKGIARTKKILDNIYAACENLSEDRRVNPEILKIPMGPIKGRYWNG